MDCGNEAGANLLDRSLLCAMECVWNASERTCSTGRAQRDGMRLEQNEVERACVRRWRRWRCGAWTRIELVRTAYADTLLGAAHASASAESVLRSLPTCDGLAYEGWLVLRWASSRDD